MRSERALDSKWPFWRRRCCRWSRSVGRSVGRLVGRSAGNYLMSPSPFLVAPRSPTVVVWAPTDTQAGREDVRPCPPNWPSRPSHARAAAQYSCFLRDEKKSKWR